MHKTKHHHNFQSVKFSDAPMQKKDAPFRYQYRNALQIFALYSIAKHIIILLFDSITFLERIIYPFRFRSLLVNERPLFVYRALYALSVNYYNSV